MTTNEELQRLAEAAIDAQWNFYSGDVAIDADTFWRPVLALIRRSGFYFDLDDYHQASAAYISQIEAWVLRVTGSTPEDLYATSIQVVDGELVIRGLDMTNHGFYERRWPCTEDPPRPGAAS